MSGERTCVDAFYREVLAALDALKAAEADAARLAERLRRRALSFGESADHLDVEALRLYDERVKP